MNYYTYFHNAIREKGLLVKDLEDKGIIAKNAIYSYSKSVPYLNNAIKIANFLEMSLDYILENVDKNHFKKYKPSQDNFYKILKQTMREMKITEYRLKKDLGISYSTFDRWEKGTRPKLSKVIDIAKYLGCNIDDLLETEK